MKDFDFNFDFEPVEYTVEDIAEKHIPSGDVSSPVLIVSENSADTPAPVAEVSEPSETQPDTSNYLLGAKPNTEAYEIAVKVAALNQQIDEKKGSISEQEAEVSRLNSEIKEILEAAQKAADALAQQRAEIEAEIFDTRKEIRRLAYELQNLERQLRIALEAQQQEDSFKAKALEFEKLTQGYRWREWALPHQIDGAKFLANAKKAILADKMGLGKTLTSLIYLDMIQAQRILLIVPSDILRNYEREIAHWAPHREIVPLGKKPKDQRDLVLNLLLPRMKQFIVTVNYEAWRKDPELLDALTKVRFDTVIMDEAHNMKNATTAAFRGVKKIVHALNSCPWCSSEIVEVETEDKWRTYEACKSDICEWTSMHADYKSEFYDKCSVKNVLPMTGTPILNRPQDLFPLLHLIDPVNFRRERDYLDAYCEQDYWSKKWKFAYGGLDRLVRRLSGKYISRDRKSAGVVLPKQTPIIHDLVMDPMLYPRQHKVITQLSKHAQIVLDSGKQLPIFYTIALITRKRQANVWPGGIQLKDAEGQVVFDVGEDVRESLKLDKIIDHNGEGLIPEFTENGNMELGERVVVFSQFKTPLIELEKRLAAAGISAVRFDGDTPEHIREQAKIDFDRKYCEVEGYEPKWQVILCNYRTGGVGLNFTAATQGIILDEEWNPGKNEQAYGRIDRIGQTEESTLHILRIQNSIDSWMAALIEEKKDMIDGFESSTDLASALLEAMKNGEVM